MMNEKESCGMEEMEPSARRNRALLVFVIASLVVLAVVIVFYITDAKTIRQLEEDVECLEARLDEIKEENKWLRSQLEMELNHQEQVDDIHKRMDELKESLDEWLEMWNISEFDLTFYTKECGYPWDDGVTFTGTTVTEGRTVAVDPDVISLGDPLYIVGYGWRLAEDIGGGVREQHIDLYTGQGPEARQRAFSLGRQKAIVIYRRTDI